MRIAIVAVLAFAAGLLVGSTLLAGGSDDATDPLDEGNLPSREPEDRERALSAGAARGSEGQSPSNPTSAEPTLAPGATKSSVFRGRARRAWALKLLDKAYADYRQQKETAVPDDLRAAASRSALAHARRSIHNFGGWTRGYIDRRRAHGELGDPPRLVLQARGGTGRIGLYPRKHLLERVVRAQPLDLSPVESNSSAAFEAYIETGVPPLDRALLIERLDVVLHVGVANPPADKPWIGKGRVQVRVDGSQVLEQRGLGEGEIRGTLHGLDVCTPPFDPPDISVDLQRAAVSVTAHGRYVSLDEASKLRDKTFRWVTEGDDGLLDDQPVTLQVLADHGGGNPRIVRLDGSVNGYMDSVVRKSLWDASLDLRKNRNSYAWFENVGAVPEGKVYRITRIDWRARLAEKVKSSDFIIRYKGKTLVERKAPNGVNVSGTWEGKLDVRAGDEKRFEIECGYFGMAEAVIQGSLIEPE